MRLAVVSDTHGHVQLTRTAITMLESLEVERVLHCGDIGSTEIIEMFTQWPTEFVFGNCDFNHADLQQAIVAAGQTCHGLFGQLEIEGRRIALLHSDDRRLFDEVCTNGEWDLVCYGHTHVAKIQQVNNTLVLNPGAIYRANPHSIAVVELPELTATLINL